MNLPAVRFIVPLYLLLSFITSSSKTFEFLEKGSSLSVESLDVLVSPNGVFTAGFYPVGFNAFSFAIWINASSTTTNKKTVVWMANRDNPVNGRGSKISLSRAGNLMLSDAGLVLSWESNTFSTSPVRLSLLNTGSLVIISTLQHQTLWESFGFPTDTLLPEQKLRKGITLISSRSETNYSSGFYKLYFDTDNVIRLVYNGPEVSSVYWPEPGSVSWGAGRTPYNDTRIASLSRLGYFDSSDNLKFSASDAGIETILRRITIDPDGNLRVYSLDKNTQTWFVSWQAFSKTCMIHGSCGPNSLCTYEVYSARRCSCMPGFMIKDPLDWSYGCEPQFVYPESTSDVGYIQMPKVEAYGYDVESLSNVTLDWCQVKCTNSSGCKGFLMRYNSDGKGVHQCWLKTQLMNGYHSPDFIGTFHFKVPKTMLPYEHREAIGLNCLSGAATIMLNRTYEVKGQNGSLMILIWVACALGGMEIISTLLVFCFLNSKYKGNEATEDYLPAATGFKRFTYHELKKATRGFNQEIGRGGSGIVYKGKLSDQRIAAIKLLNQANQGEAEFLVEVSTLSRLNHMNLIQMWGYCAEGKHRLLVYEYMELGSLAANLARNDALDWEKRFEIALGTAKGLAYLHEECLEWILHCDIKPQNVLLDSNYQPKVADFGLSKLVNRGANSNTSFTTTIRGTRGYMAPEWVFNLPITSKVDVYSYGIVVLEMLTGKSPDGIQSMEDAGQVENWKKRLRSMSEEIEGRNVSESWIDDFVDPSLGGEFEMKKLKVLVRLALKCVEDDKDARPTMSQVVNILQSFDDDEVYNF